MRVQDANNIHPDEIAQRVGLKFARTQLGTHGQENVYHTSIRDDKSPSLHINLESYKFYDNGIQFGSRGAINFICYLYGIEHTDPHACRQALRILDSIYSDVSFQAKTHSTKMPIKSATNLKKNSSSHIEVVSTKPLFSFSLKEYLTNTRKLNIDIVNNYVVEVTCKTQQGKQFFGIGSRAGNNTFVIRNKGRDNQGMKLVAGKNLDITVYEQNSNEVLLFEGDIDFYTYLTSKKIQQAPNTAIVLNSVAMIKNLYSYLEKNSHITTIKFFRDNDNAGTQALKSLLENTQNIAIEDQAKHYTGFKDLNEWWCHKQGI